MDLSTDSIVSLSMKSVVAFLVAIGFKEPAKKIGGIISDQLEFLQFKNQVKILERAAEFCRRRNLDPAIIPKSFSFSLLDSAKNEDDDCLQKTWAALLGSAAIGHPVHPAYISLIKELTAIEVKVLKEFYLKVQGLEEKNIDKNYYYEIIKKYLLEVDPSNTMNLNDKVISGNLMRLNLIRLVINAKTQKYEASLSPFAADFIVSCSWE